MDAFIQNYITPFYNTIYPAWIDSLWLLIILVLARKNQRILSVLFVLSGMAMMRLQVEMLNIGGYTHGIVGLLSQYSIFFRGLIVYSVIYAGFVLFLRLAPRSRGSMLLATTISFFLMAFFASTILMVL